MKCVSNKVRLRFWQQLYGYDQHVQPWSQNAGTEVYYMAHVVYLRSLDRFSSNLWMMLEIKQARLSLHSEVQKRTEGI